MADQRTSCMVDGDTFTGRFSATGRGSDAVVTVRYGGQERTVRLGSFSETQTAQRLLGELVRDHIAGGTAAAPA